MFHEETEHEVSRTHRSHASIFVEIQSDIQIDIREDSYLYSYPHSFAQLSDENL